jgi:ABC-type dipeptide/oligopeptide/nickel transport system ATPase component
MTPLLEISGLRVSYPGSDEPVEVVHGIDLVVPQGRKVALVGESGSGKSVTARSVLQLDPDAAISGSIRLGGQELVGAPPRTVRGIRGSGAGLVFQDPLTSLNPVVRIGWQIMQPLVIRGVSKREARERGIALLDRLGVVAAAARFDDYPHQFSGGMRQRVVIAIAIIAEPSLLIADEPTTALDVQVQAQVLELLHEVADERGMGVLLITHDLAIVAGFADDVVVMRHGEVVEAALVDELFAAPKHPYTRGLLGAIPRLDSDPSVRLTSVADYVDIDPGVDSASRSGEPSVADPAAISDENGAER